MRNANTSRGRAVPVVAGVVLLVAVVVGGLLLGHDTAVSGTATAVPTTTGSTERDRSTGRDPGGAHAQVGDCVTFPVPELVDTLAQEVDCAAPDAVYEVGYRNDNGTTGTCPTQSYDQYTQTGRDGDFMLCLMMNGQVGECFTGYSGPDKWKSKVDCASADVVVSARLDDRVDPSVCPPTSGWQLSYPERSRTICLDALG